MASSPTILCFISFLILISFSFNSADDVSHDDIFAPRSPSCNNKFQLVKVMTWVNNTKSESLVGLSARFGASLPSHAENAVRLPGVFANPLNCCTTSSSKLSNSIALSMRGDCAFTVKAQVAESGGASALLVINDNEDLYKMVCSENDTSLNISIPVVMIPKSGGELIKESMLAGGLVELLLYSPNRPVVDLSVFVLWLMAVGTIVCASLWPEFIASEQHDESYNQLTPKDSSSAEAVKDDPKEVLDINARGAVVFVISASVVLLLLYFFMSSWLVWLLIVLFCIGGTEVVCFSRLPIQSVITKIGILLLPSRLSSGMFWLQLWLSDVVFFGLCM